MQPSSTPTLHVSAHLRQPTTGTEWSDGMAYGYKAGAAATAGSGRGTGFWALMRTREVWAICVAQYTGGWVGGWTGGWVDRRVSGWAGARVGGREDGRVGG